MSTYIALMNFTDQGVRHAKDTVKRYEAAAKLGKELGVTFKGIHWTLGAYDMVCELEAKDDSAITAFGLAVGSLGNVRTQTLRAFSADEMKGILTKLP